MTDVLIMQTEFTHHADHKFKKDMPPLECGICMNPINPLTIQVKISCKEDHPYCFPCWTQWATECVNSGRVPDIPCLQNGCTETLNCQTMIGFIFEKQPAIFEQYLTKSLYRSIQLPERMVRCLGNCRTMWIVDCTDCSETQCPKCKMETCARCLALCHPGLTCDENREKVSTAEGWIDSFTKKCPKCLIDIQKWGGCNSMTCSQCSTVFCWMCRETFGPEGNNHDECYRKMESEERFMQAQINGIQETEETQMSVLRRAVGANARETRNRLRSARRQLTQELHRNRFELQGASAFVGREVDTLPSQEEDAAFALDAVFGAPAEQEELLMSTQPIDRSNEVGFDPVAYMDAVVAERLEQERIMAQREAEQRERDRIMEEEALPWLLHLYTAVEEATQPQTTQPQTTQPQTTQPQIFPSDTHVEEDFGLELLFGLGVYDVSPFASPKAPVARSLAGITVALVEAVRNVVAIGSGVLGFSS
eukprot:TRINITY_DN210_c0_g3_i4.p1 TRINITY_DN210_c0_g3~~TRINITY_DN210_c0_g3_i4.p1  ORF type:complete len:479 (-),score=90.94 TRINITY_DN210_c0_g3_i4:471-1907(-)